MFFCSIVSGVRCKMFRRINPVSRLFLLLATFSSVAATDDSFGLKLTTESSKVEGTQYSFHYFVKDEKTGDYKTQKETKDGDSVHGSYTLAEPNGDLRTVTYKAGPGTGFEAKVDFQPSKSPMKQTTDATVNSAFRTTKTEKPTTLESTVNHFPGGFEMDISSKPQMGVKTEMGMKFSLNTNPVTEPVTSSTKTVTIMKNTVAEIAETKLANHYETTTTIYNLESSGLENSTIPAEGRESTENPIEKEIDDAINSMPKLPELILSDNKTHFKFHKDPEEALLDERITQIARQLAETSLRREYEERKLGHFIPISVASIDSSPTTHFSKSFKFKDNTSSSPSTPKVLTQMRVVPQYIYTQTISGIESLNNRLPGIGKTIQKPQQWEQQTYEKITNPPDILKVNKSETNKISKIKDKKFNYKTTITEPKPVLPIHVPTFIQFFTPYVMQAPGNYPQQEKLQQQYVTTTRTDSTNANYYDPTPYKPATIVSENTQRV